MPPLAIAVPNAKAPFALIGRVLEPLSCKTNPVPESPETMTLIVKGPPGVEVELELPAGTPLQPLTSSKIAVIQTRKKDFWAALITFIVSLYFLPILAPGYPKPVRSARLASRHRALGPDCSHRHEGGGAVVSVLVLELLELLGGFMVRSDFVSNQFIREEGVPTCAITIYGNELSLTYRHLKR